MTTYKLDDYPSDSDRAAICDWLRRHSIDPSSIAMPGWIEVRDNARQIAYQAYARNADGSYRLNDEGDDVVRVARVVDLELPPMPFPVGGPA